MRLRRQGSSQGRQAPHQRKEIWKKSNDPRNPNDSKQSGLKSNWEFNGSFKDYYRPDKIKALKTKVPAFNGKQLCLSRGVKGFCPDWCTNFHGQVGKTEEKFCKFVKDNNLPSNPVSKQLLESL